MVYSILYPKIGYFGGIVATMFRLCFLFICACYFIPRGLKSPAITGHSIRLCAVCGTVCALALPASSQYRNAARAIFLTDTCAIHYLISLSHGYFSRISAFSRACLAGAVTKWTISKPANTPRTKHSISTLPIHCSIVRALLQVPYILGCLPRARHNLPWQNDSMYIYFCQVPYFLGHCVRHWLSIIYHRPLSGAVCPAPRVPFPPAGEGH